MENRFVQIVPANTVDNNVNTLFGLDAQGEIWWGVVLPGVSIEWTKVRSERK
jgi:hypothetical protein